jgi:hypothetical protein
MKNILFPVEINFSIGSIPSSGKTNLFEIEGKKISKFSEVILRIMAKVNGSGMIVCRMKENAIIPIKIDSSGNEGVIV